MFSIIVPLVDRQYILSLKPGSTTFVLGPNGSGKSSIMQHIMNQIPDPNRVKWIQAHRRSWIGSHVLSLTSDQVSQGQANVTSYMRAHDARYRVFNDDFLSQSSIALLIQRKNADARKVVQLLMTDRYHEAKGLATGGDVLHTLNAALQQSNIPIVVSIGDKDDVLATKRGLTYGVDEMSDGERSALLVAASILTADEGTFFLLDEPERHLHRAIISPLLSTLFSARPDCGFVISTHEIALPMDNPGADVMLVRECFFSGGKPARWDIDLIGADLDISEAVLSSILGARRTLIFVEGDQSSLDYPLYAQIFPNTSVIPVGSCAKVINSVKSIRSSSKHHRISAFGIVDRDYLSSEDVKIRERDGIFVVDGYAVESIYYDSEMQRMVVERYAHAEDARERLQRSRASVLSWFGHSAQEMYKSRAVARRREMAIGALDSLGITEETLPLNGVVLLEEERRRLEAMMNEGDVDSLIGEYPVKKSPVLPRIAKDLGFSDRRTYESAVLHLLGESDKARTYVRGRFEGLLGAMEEERTD